MLLVLKKNVEEVNRIFNKIKINKFENNGKIIIQIKNLLLKFVTSIL